MKEKISALIDGHGHPDQRRDLFDRIVSDDEACRIWRHYHLIGCVLRGEVEQAGADINERIRVRLEDESTEPADSVVSIVPVEYVAHAKPARSQRRAEAWKPAGLLALAASLALVAVFALKPAPDDGAQTVAATKQANKQAKFEQEFSEMLSQHGEFTSSPGLNGLIVYAKLVNNESIDR